MTRLLGKVPPHWRNRIDSWKWWMGVSYFVIALVIVWVIYENNNTHRDALRTHAVLCTYRDDLGGRTAKLAADVQEAIVFAHRHPHGILDISHGNLITAIILQQKLLRGSQRALTSLNGLHC